MAKRTDAVTRVTRGDVLDGLDFARSDATVLKLKADLLDAMRAEIERRHYTQRRLSAFWMSISQLPAILFGAESIR